MRSLWTWLVLHAVLFHAPPLYPYRAFRTSVPDHALPTLAPGFRLRRAAASR